MKLESQMSIQIVKNEKLVCRSCLISSAGPKPDESVLCHLDRTKDELKNKEDFCVSGMWLIHHEVMDFKKGFQTLYNKDKSTGEGKEIKV